MSTLSLVDSCTHFKTEGQSLRLYTKQECENPACKKVVYESGVTMRLKGHSLAASRVFLRQQGLNDLPADAEEDGLYYNEATDRAECSACCAATAKKEG